jgi:hypothetical protein
MSDSDACHTSIVSASWGEGEPQETVIARPRVIDDVLVNPGIGFMTFQRFNGDTMNQGVKWTEGYPIDYQPFTGSLTVPGHPLTSLAYFRIYWKFVEPSPGEYNWDLLDHALKTAAERGQTLLLRIAPYGTNDDNDVPDWYREMLGPESQLPVMKWRTNPEDPRYVERFGAMVRAVGERYDGHPDLESVDVAIVGAWGEGAGSERLSPSTREALVDAYLEAFPTTHLLMLLTDPATNGYGLSKREVGWRVDCLGDMRSGPDDNWCHMYDYYPQAIINCGMRDAWQKAPVSLEVCWVMQHWYNMGWDIGYIIDQSLKWHISSFNTKSSAVPEAWWPQVNRWLRGMGYRLALRKLTYPTHLRAGGVLPFTTWWENLGVAPCYHRFRFALRLKGGRRSWVLPTDADIRGWLPGDALHDGAVGIPPEVPPGEHELQVAVIGTTSERPKVHLAIAGEQDDGWYTMGPAWVDA